MEDTLFVSNLTQLVKKIVVSFCKSNVSINSSLEILGSIHVKIDNQDLVAFVLNEKYNCNQIDQTEDEYIEEQTPKIKVENVDSYDQYTEQSQNQIKKEQEWTNQEETYDESYNNNAQAEEYDNSYYENNNDDYHYQNNTLPTFVKTTKRKLKKKPQVSKFATEVDPTDEKTFYQVNPTYSCKVCSSQFRSMDGLKCHINSKHSQRKLYHCQFCPQYFLTRQASYSHRVKFHNMNKFKLTSFSSTSSKPGPVG